MNPKTKSAEILIIDENKNHTEKIRSVFTSGKTVCNIQIFNDYDHGLSFVRGLDKFLTGKPDILITDVQTSDMKQKYEIIREVKSNPDLAHIPVIVFSSENDSDVIKKCYSMNINSFIRKPDDDVKFDNVVGNIENFWFSTAKLSFMP
jgi:CheY-like chemotaxis protein